VDFADYAIPANQRSGRPGIPSADITPLPDCDKMVDFLGFAIFAEHWLEQE